MAVSVEGDRVAGGHDLGDQSWPADHLLADQKEGRARVRTGKRIQDGGRALGVRPVVEGERDSGPITGLALDSQCGSQRPDGLRGSRQEMRTYDRGADQVRRAYHDRSSMVLST
jgi:hypothetical protein